MIKSYKDLIVWQRAMELVTEIYRISKSFPKEEIFGLTSQIRRAAVSVPSNIAEGHGRMTGGEYLQALGHARGSLMEVETQMAIAMNLSFLRLDQTKTAAGKIDETGRMLNTLIASVQRRSK